MMTDTQTQTIKRISLDGDAMNPMTPSADTFSLIAAAQTRTAPQTFASLDRAALYATFWSSAHTPEAKQRRALEMREAGYTLTEIARELGYAGKSGAQYAIRQARAQREGVRDVA